MTDRNRPLVAEGLRKRFGDAVALDGVDLSIEPGELLALVGPSGCGKSTLLRSIAGLVQLDEGTIALDGVLVDDGSSQLPPERRSVGLVFQEHALFPHLRVRENVGFGVRDGSRSTVRSRIDDMLALVDLDGFGDRYPHELSGGERQRVALARALAPRPALMLLDEPFASLDHNLRIKLRRAVTAALDATDTPAVFVTHDQSEALAVGDRIAVMRSGRIQQLDEPTALFHRPVSRFVASFMGPASFLPVNASADGSRTSLGHVDAGEPGDVAMVRPDDVVFDSAVGGTATIVAAEYHGSGWLATALDDAGSEVLVAMSHLDAPRVGQRGLLQLVAGHRQVVISAGSDAGGLG